MHDSMLTDAHCADTAKSAGIQFALGVMRTAPWRHLPPVQLDARWARGWPWQGSAARAHALAPPVHTRQHGLAAPQRPPDNARPSALPGLAGGCG